MVISHTYRYLFVELPQTGSSAIAQELCELYEGKRILKKHATYRDFSHVATDDEKSYFVFSGIRNPMDKVLSLYFKYKTDHATKKQDRVSYDNPEFYRGSNFLIAWLMKRQYRFVRDSNATFADFFRRFYRVPYDDWSCLNHDRIDYVIHFENLADEFAEALNKIGISPQRELPVRNKTRERDSSFWSYYSPHLCRRARWVFEPYFHRWGYSFPDDWPRINTRMSEAVYRAVNIFRKVYWRFIR